MSFNHIPDNWRPPLFWAEIDGSQAGNAVHHRPIVLFGHGLNTNDANTAVQGFGLDQVRDRFGVTSQLAAMYEFARAANTVDEILLVNVAEPSAGNKATGTIEVTTAPSAAGTLALYIAGQRVQVAAAASDTANGFATKIADAINAATYLPVTASATTATVTLTCRWNGLTGNDIDIRHSYRGMQGGEELPTGLGLTITAMNGGTGAPDVDTAIANLGDQDAENVALAWADDATLDAFDAEFAFGDAGRWGFARQVYGHVYSAVDDDAAGLTTHGTNRNGPTLATFGIKGSPTPSYARAASWAAVHHRALVNDPARPLHTLKLPGVLAPEKKDRFGNLEHQTLLFKGISLGQAHDDGSVSILKSITNYRENAYGTADDAFLKVNTLATNAYLLRSMRYRVESRYGRHKLANDGTRFGPGQAVATPLGIKAELVSLSLEHEFNGLVENIDQFLRNLIVERHASNANRVNVLYPPDLMNQLDVFAVLNQFRLQYSSFQTQGAVPLV